MIILTVRLHLMRPTVGSNQINFFKIILLYPHKLKVDLVTIMLNKGKLQFLNDINLVLQYFAHVLNIINNLFDGWNLSPILLLKKLVLNTKACNHDTAEFNFAFLTSTIKKHLKVITIRWKDKMAFKLLTFFYLELQFEKNGLQS